METEADIYKYKTWDNCSTNKTHTHSQSSLWTRRTWSKVQGHRLLWNREVWAVGTQTGSSKNFLRRKEGQYTAPRQQGWREHTWKHVPASWFYLWGTDPSVHRWRKARHLSWRGVGTVPNLFWCANATASCYTGLYVLTVSHCREQWDKTSDMVLGWLTMGLWRERVSSLFVNSWFFNNITGLRLAWASPDTVSLGIKDYE